MYRQATGSRHDFGKSSATRKRGVVLLLAIFVSSVALAVGFGVYNRTYKELLLASFWRQTQTAFSAADSGLECALYWQLHPSTPVTCFGQTVSGWTPGSAGSFEVNTVPGVGPCVNVVIAWDAGLSATTTTSRGYNDICGSTSLRRVERGLGAALQ